MSIDRLYLNAYIPELQRPELVRRFLEREVTPIASPALFRIRSDAFVKSLRTYAKAQGAPWIVFERGERKEDRMKPLFAAAEARLLPGLVAVGVAQPTAGHALHRIGGPSRRRDRLNGRSAGVMPDLMGRSQCRSALCPFRPLCDAAPYYQHPVRQ